MHENRSLRWIAVITAEKVDKARKVLGLGETARYADMRRRYRDLARVWHPDVCAERDPSVCAERFRSITNAKNLLMRLIRLYRYSLRREDIERDQEPYGVTFYRIYGNLLGGDGGPDPVRELEKAHPGLITAEKILEAAETLGLSDFAPKAAIESAYRSRMQSASRRERPAPGAHSVAGAYELLMKYVDRYRYSFRPDDIRNYQEDAIERHRRQFGNEPMWAGGAYDAPDW